MGKITDENWSLRGVAITGLADSRDYQKVTLAQHHILDSTRTTLHYTDSPDRYRDIEFMLWSDTWETDFLPYVASGGAHLLVSDFGVEGLYYIAGANAKRVYDYRAGCSGSYYWRVNMSLRKNLNGY